MDCALRLRRQHRITPGQIAGISCRTAEGPVPRLWEPLASKHKPANGYENQKQLETLTATTIDKLMTEDVVTISSQATVQDLTELFLHKKGNPIPVVDDGKLVGIVSRADIVKLIAGKDLLSHSFLPLAKGE